MPIHVIDGAVIDDTHPLAVEFVADATPDSHDVDGATITPANPLPIEVH